MSGIETIRHSLAHVLAQAVKSLYPKVLFGMGPAIEDGFYYDFDKLNISEEDLKKIENKMHEIIKKKIPIKKILLERRAAIKKLDKQKYKLELLKDIKDKKLSFYEQDDFIDLCIGPHVKNTSELPCSFKLTRIAGAYWKGDSKNKMLTRIYGIAFNTQEELDDYIKLQEEAEKRNHIKLGKELDLFSFHPEGPGFPFIHPKGMVIWNELLKYWNEEHEKENYTQIKTPIVLSKELWLKSGHWDHYKENMYFTKIDDNEYAIKPMNCPGGMLVYKEKLHSYREFPLRIAEIGLVHRHELSGVLNGLFRVRAFHQDDAHIFISEDMIKEEVINIYNLIERIYKTFNFDFHVELSTMPKKAMGDPKVWKKAEAALEDTLKSKNIKFKINPGDGAFYGPKIDFHIKDSIGRTWQCATIQLDFLMPEKFDLTYEGSDGKKHRPIMLHRVVYGSLERFMGILIEHYAGKFPLWLSPVQVIILPIADRHFDYAKEISEKLIEKNIRVEIDDRSESISKKVRDAQMQKIPIMLTVGDKEQENRSLAIRTLDGKVEFGVKIDQFTENILEKIKKRN